VSVDELPPDDRERYLDLAVFPEDEPIPEGPLQVLWGVTPAKTRACLDRLAATPDDLAACGLVHGYGCSRKNRRERWRAGHPARWQKDREYRQRSTVARTPQDEPRNQLCEFLT
jgi:hypothetical protein